MKSKVKTALGYAVPKMFMDEDLTFTYLKKCGIVHLPALHFKLPLQFGLSLLHRKWLENPRVLTPCRHADFSVKVNGEQGWVLPLFPINPVILENTGCPEKLLLCSILKFVVK